MYACVSKCVADTGVMHLAASHSIHFVLFNSFDEFSEDNARHNKCVHFKGAVTPSRRLFVTLYTVQGVILHLPDEHLRHSKESNYIFMKILWGVTARGNGVV